MELKEATRNKGFAMEAENTIEGFSAIGVGFDVITECFYEIGRILGEWEEHAMVADPGLREHVERLRENDPDIGWMDVAEIREKRASPHLASYLGGFDG